MNKPHKHAELIKAWADGAEIEFKGYSRKWEDVERPVWSEWDEYRLKPAPKEIIQLHEYLEGSVIFSLKGYPHQEVKWTIDPETNKILKVELVE